MTPRGSDDSIVVRTLDALTAPLDRSELLAVIAAEKVRDAAEASDVPLAMGEARRLPRDRPRMTLRAEGHRHEVTLGEWSSISAVLRPFGRILYRLARVSESVLEIGTGSGVSTAYLALGVSDHGCLDASDRLITVDCNETLTAQALRRLRTVVGIESVSAIVADEDAVDLALLERLHPDLIHYDTLHTYESCAAIARRLAGMPTTAVVCFDDIRWSDGMEDFWHDLSDGTFGQCHAMVDFYLWGVAVLGGQPEADVGVLKARPPMGHAGAILRT